MMCLESAKQANTRRRNLPAQPTSAYLYSCFEKCASFFDSFWNPWGIGRSTKMEFISEDSGRKISDVGYVYGEKFSDVKTFENTWFSRRLIENSLVGRHLSFFGAENSQNIVLSPPSLGYLFDQQSKMKSMSNEQTHPEFKLLPPVISLSVPNSQVIKTSMVLSSVNPMQERAAKVRSEDLKTVTGKGTVPPNSVSEPSVAVSGTPKGVEVLNQEMVTRKSRKLNKCSRKRRRRQKRQNRAEVIVTSRLPADVHINLEKPSKNNFIGNCKESGDKSVSKQPLSSTNRSSGQGSLKTEFVSESKSSISIADDRCTNPMISFILGHAVDSESDGDSDFETNTSGADVEFSFMNSLNCITLGISSLTAFPDTEEERTDCMISISFSEMSPEVIDANKKWSRNMKDTAISADRLIKVSFASDLVNVFPAEDYDRKGEWERYALERCRFQRRINEAEHLLSPVLLPAHREKVFLKLQSASS